LKWSWGLSGAIPIGRLILDEGPVEAAFIDEDVAAEGAPPRLLGELGQFGPGS